MKILILGGYGVFGGRLAQLLHDVPELTLFICGRSMEKAQVFCAGFEGFAAALPIGLDRRNIADGLVRLKPDLVVDASGPFQDYNVDRYRIVEACIAAKINYLDFADGADFVFGISQFDEQARAAGVFVLSGVSSFPVLSAAVLREMAKTMDIVKVEGGIAPSPYAGIGLNVMRAVVGYAGAPVTLTRNGMVSSGVGLAESIRYTVAAPGRLPLRNIRFSLVDVPDLQVLPPEHPTMTDIWMGAGPVPEILHRILNLLAKARHWFNLPSFVPLSRLFYTVLNLMKFGEHRGGMFVRADGISNGQRVKRSWHLLAEADDGPFIPSMAIEGIIRKSLDGQLPKPGARPATHALELSDYDQLFAERTIYTGFREEWAGEPIYRRVLGSAFDSLPDEVRALHGSIEERQWSGTASVQRGSGFFARIVAALIGFPKAAETIPVSVTFSPDGNGEKWTRTFGRQSFHSRQQCGHGRNTHLLVERFGIVDVALALVVDGDRLNLIPRHWSVVGIPLPKSLLPRGTSFETQREGKFCFDVTIALPVVGHVVSYQGFLVRVEATLCPKTYTLNWATPPDYAALADVMFDAVRNGPSKYTQAQRAAWVPERGGGEEWAARLDSQVIALAHDDTRAVGFMSMAHGGYIDFAYIRPEAQGSGLFRPLFAMIEDKARSQTEPRLWTHASLMAEPAFAAVGFAVVKHEVVRIGDERFKRAKMDKALMIESSQ